MAPLYMIDAIGPFFRGVTKRTINWSKIPFWHIDPTREDRHEQWRHIRTDLDQFCSRGSAVGFNSISLDDVAHLADHPWYELEVRAKIRAWREEFRRCFEIAGKHHLDIYLTLDVFTATAAMREHLHRSRWSIEDFLAELLATFFRDFPEVRGVIMRIGESDGRDVRDVFRSELYLKSAGQVNRFLKKVLPVFVAQDRILVLRTWTVGAHAIGDLMWHHRTFERMLRDVDDCPNLIVSMKYGESDFFRFLPLSGNFFRSRVGKLVELQTRREYEGCGEYPSFVGWDYERYAKELRGAKNMRGFMVWCQTGGWVPFRRRALIDESAIWTDLNTFVTVRVFTRGQPVEDAVRDFARERDCHNPTALLKLLQLSESAIHQLLYTKEYSRSSLFFRRVRIPPLFSVYWHNIFINDPVRRILSHFVPQPEQSLEAAQSVLATFTEMKRLAGDCGFPAEDIEFMEDTFRLLSLAREYYFGEMTEDFESRLRQAKRAYKAKYPKSGPRYRYRIKISLQPLPFKSAYIALALYVLLRRESRYRWVDRLVLVRLLSWTFRVIAKRRPQWIPEFARESAMGMEAVFR